MSEETKETDRLNGGALVEPDIKYKDPCIFLCSRRWRTCVCIYLSFTLLYMHRVNLSLAVVCMVDTGTSGSRRVAELYSDRESGKNASDQNMNYTFYSNSSEQSVGSNLTTADVTNDIMTHDVTKVTEKDEIDADDTCGSVIRKEKDWTPELHWTKSEMSILLSSYFYGSFFTQIPAGTMADRFGGKHIVTVALLISTVLSLLTPICARTSILLMFMIRIGIGLAGGSVIPACMSMVNAWSLPDERTLMIAFTGTGLLSGTIVTYLTSGLLCAFGFDGGWPSIFYIHGGLSAVFVVLWCFDAYSQPSQHPRISERELKYILASKGHTTNIKRPKTPWKRLLLSRPLWAVIVAHFCFNWSFFTVLINVPLFLKEVLRYDIKSNGLFSALPFVFQMISCLICGKMSAVVINRRILGHLATRRLFNTICLVGISVCLVSAGYVSCEMRYVAVILLCISSAFAGFGYGGFFANHPEFAGQFAGTAFGITNAGGVISSLLASMLAGLLTPNGLQEEWQVVFYLAAGINVLGTVAFCLCSDVHLQPWARNQEVLSIEVDACAPNQDKTSGKELSTELLEIVEPNSKNKLNQELTESAAFQTETESHIVEEPQETTKLTENSCPKS